MRSGRGRDDVRMILRVLMFLAQCRAVAGPSDARAASGMV